MSQELPPQIDTSRPRKKSESMLSGLSKSAGAASKMVAMQAERTKLNTLTLPAAYRALGKDCLREKRHLECAAELTGQLRSVLAEIKQLSEAASGQDAPQSFTDKAKAVGKQTFDVARTKQIGMKRNSLIANIGKAIYSTHADKSGPIELVAPIGLALARVSEIEAEIGQQSQVGKGKFVTSKRMLVGAAIGVIIVLGVASRLMTKNSGGQQNQIAEYDASSAMGKPMASSIEGQGGNIPSNVGATKPQGAKSTFTQKHMYAIEKINKLVRNSVSAGSGVRPKGGVYVDYKIPNKPSVAVELRGYIRGSDLECLAELDTIDLLDIMNTTVTDITDISNLKTLSAILLPEINSEQYEAIVQLPNLQSLVLVSADQQVLDSISRMQSLRHLLIYQIKTKSIPTFTSLLYLELRNKPPWGAGQGSYYGAIADQPNLQSLVIVNQSMPGGSRDSKEAVKQAEQLWSFKNLKTISLNELSDQLYLAHANNQNLPEFSIRKDATKNVSDSMLTRVRKEHPQFRVSEVTSMNDLSQWTEFVPIKNYELLK